MAIKVIRPGDRVIPAHYRTDYPAAEGRTVLQGHADACRDHGHAYHLNNGTVDEECPRCGDTLTVDDAYRIILNNKSLAESFRRPMLADIVDIVGEDNRTDSGALKSKGQLVRIILADMQ